MGLESTSIKPSFYIQIENTLLHFGCINWTQNPLLWVSSKAVQNIWILNHLFAEG